MNRFIKCEKKNDILFKKVCVDGFDKLTTIIVPDTHNAIIVKDGVALDTLSSGKHMIFNKKQAPFGKELFDFQTVDVIFVSKTAKLNILWGTQTQFDMRDPIYNVSIKLGASGEFEVQICNPRKAYLELIGQSEEFNIDDLKERLLGRLLAEVQFHLANIMNEKKLSYDRLGEVLLPISQNILPHIAKMFEEDYGLRIFSFTISRVIISQEDVDRIESAKKAVNARNIAIQDKKEEERLKDKLFDQQLDLKKIERNDYDKYLEVVKSVGWPQKKSNETSNSKECVNCGVKLTADAKFCPVCGVEILKAKSKCPNCGKLIGHDDLFCKHCGVKVRG